MSFCPRRRSTKAEMDVEREKTNGEGRWCGHLKRSKEHVSLPPRPPLSPQGAYKSSTICYSPEKGTWTELEGEVAEPLAGPACSTVTLPACLPFNK